MPWVFQVVSTLQVVLGAHFDALCQMAKKQRSHICAHLPLMRSRRGTQASWDMGLGWPAVLNISCRRRPFTLPRIARSRAYRPAGPGHALLNEIILKLTIYARVKALPGVPVYRITPATPHAACKRKYACLRTAQSETGDCNVVMHS